MKSIKPFIKLNAKSEKLTHLLATRPQAFTLLTLIAKRAKREDDPVTGLKKGEAIVSDFESYGSTRQQHRTNLSTLKINHEITTQTTRRGTSDIVVVKLISSDIYDINISQTNQSANQSPNPQPTSEAQKSTSDQPVNQPRTKNIRNKEKEIKNIEIENAKKYISLWNEIRGTKVKTFEPVIENLKYWLTQYTFEDIEQAIRNIPKHKFWWDKMTHVMLLRGKNQQSECVDHIGELLNLSPVKTEILKPIIPERKVLTPEEIEKNRLNMETIRANNRFLANSLSIGGNK